MSQEERFDTRDRSYSAWHRRQSTRRYVGIESAQLLAMIDLDAAVYVEYDDGTKEPLALIEAAIDTGQPYKTATVTKKLAQLSTRRVLPAYVLLYRLSSKRKNPANQKYFDIEGFRVKRIWPNPEWEWRILSPDQWAKELLSLRRHVALRIDQMEATF